MNLNMNFTKETTVTDRNIAIVSVCTSSIILYILYHRNYISSNAKSRLTFDESLLDIDADEVEKQARY